MESTDRRCWRNHSRSGNYHLSYQICWSVALSNESGYHLHFSLQYKNLKHNFQERSVIASFIFRSHRGYQSSSQHPPKTVISVRNHTMFHTLCWYFLHCLSCISYWKSFMIVPHAFSVFHFHVSGEIQLGQHWWNWPAWRYIEAACGFSWWHIRKSNIGRKPSYTMCTGI